MNTFYIPHTILGTDDEKNLKILPEAAQGLFVDDKLIAVVDKSIESNENLYDDASVELKNIRRRIF